MRFLSSFCIALFLACALLSCSESEADVVSAQATAIFDFANDTDPPVNRLAVFLQVANEVQRSEYFTVFHAQSGYSWLVAKPGVFTGMNKSYAYSVSLNPPDSEPIPTGSYSVTYADAAGNEDEMSFTVSYDKSLLTATSETFKDFVPNASENIAIYDDAGELLFMGKAKASWKTAADIRRDYKVAETKRVCFVTPGNTVICMMPEEKLTDNAE